jgi:hypothetical protein
MAGSGPGVRIEDYASVELTNLRIEGGSECVLHLGGCGRCVLSKVCLWGTQARHEGEASPPERCIGLRCERKQNSGRGRAAGLSMLGCQVRGISAQQSALGVHLVGLRCIRVCGLLVDGVSAKQQAAGLVCTACSNGAFDNYEARNLWSLGNTTAGQFLDSTLRCELFEAQVASASPQRPPGMLWLVGADCQIKFWEVVGGKLQQKEM